MFLDCRSLVDPSPSTSMGGLAVVHPDRGGRPAVLVAGMSGPNRLFRFDAGRLVDTAGPMLADPGAATFSVAGADVDRDGREELYLHNSEVRRGAKRSTDRLLKCLDGQWFDRLDGLPDTAPVNRIAARGIAAFDRRGGGKYGFLIAAQGGPVRLLETDAVTGELVDYAPSTHLDEIVAANGFVIGPIGTETSRVFLASAVGPDLLFTPRPEGTFAEIAGDVGLLADPGSCAAVLVDLDHDGRLDLLLAGMEGPHRMMVLGGDERWHDVTPPLFAEPSPVRGMVVADFDNDGYEEIFLHHHGEPNRLFGWREGGWRPLDLGDALEPAAPGLACAAADLDGDGRLELLTTYGDGGQGRFGWFRTAADPGHHWIRIAPTTAAGAPARGARVALEAGGRRQVRMIDAGSGYLSQSEPVAHFGLGRIDRVDQVAVLWPDGTETRHGGLAADRQHPLAHPARNGDFALRGRA